MHIVVVHQYYLKKGQAGGSRFNQFVKYWSEKGHKITVICGMVDYTAGTKFAEYNGKTFVHEKDGDNVDIVRCHVSPAYNKSFVGRLWAYFSFTFFSTLAGLGVKNADVMITTSPPLTVAITGRILQILKGWKWIFEVRDLWPESAIDTGVLKNGLLIQISYDIEKMAYKHANLINVLTPAFRQALIEKKGVSQDKIIEIYNAADLDLFSPGEKENEIRKQYQLNGKFVITYMGAHGVANRVGQILDVAKQIKDKDIVFLLVGDGMEKVGLVERAKKESLENVIFIDSQPKEKIVEICRASDVCTAVLQKNDTFKTVYPNKVFDYMACAVPIILAIDGVARELVETANAGIYVEPENTQQFVDAVMKLKNDPKYCKELGKNGYEFVTENFNRDVFAERYLKEIEKLMHQHTKLH